MPANLRSFFNDFHAKSESAVRQLWKYSEFETKLGLRREVSFIGGCVVIQETPPNNELSVLVMQVSDTRVYRHAAYALTFLLDDYLTGDLESLTIRLYGHAYQAFVPVNSFDVKPVQGLGTIETVDRFGNPREKELARVHAVTIKRKEQGVVHG
jgi:hypothetical protein